MPLELWEDRYIEMARECLDQDGEFGVVLIDEGKEVGGPVQSTYRIGTTAKLAYVNEQEDHISALAVGQEKFRIGEILQTEPRMRARVKPIAADTSAGISPELIDDVRGMFDEYMALVMKLVGFPEIEMTIPEDPDRLSYMIAAHLQTDATVRQGLLEIHDPGRRLARCRELMGQARDDYRLILTATEGSADILSDDGMFSNN